MIFRTVQTCTRKSNANVVCLQRNRNFRVTWYGIGLAIAYNPLRLIEKTDYFKSSDDGKCCVVKIVDLGGRFVKLGELDNNEKDILSRQYLTGDRATVHLTDGLPYQGKWEIFNNSVDLIERLLKTNLYEDTIEQNVKRALHQHGLEAVESKG